MESINVQGDRVAASMEKFQEIQVKQMEMMNSFLGNFLKQCSKDDNNSTQWSVIQMLV